MIRTSIRTPVSTSTSQSARRPASQAAWVSARPAARPPARSGLSRPLLGLLAVLALVLPGVAAQAAQPSAGDGGGADLALPQGDYVALGDSYASGFGVPPYEEGTKVEDGNNCQRSELAYAHLVSQQTGKELSFRACAGARTADFYQANTAWEEPAQLDALSAQTGLVTFSVGGNDAGFAQVLGECLRRAQQGDLGACSTDEQVAARVDSAIDALRGDGEREGTYSYDALLSDVAARAPQAQVVVVGYQPMFPAEGAEDSTGRCEGVLSEDQSWMVAKTRELNAVIKEAAQEHGMLFVDPSESFAGHELCSSDPWFFGALSEGRFHPTEQGHKAMADDVMAALEEARG